MPRWTMTSASPCRSTIASTPRLELMIGLDWNQVDYDVTVAPGDAAAGLGFSATGELEYWTPRVGLNFNFLETRPDAVRHGRRRLGFIDTNIPDSPPQTACWWDPWWGYYCGTYQSTRSIDELVYDSALGVRWDISVDDHAAPWRTRGTGSTWARRTSTPGFDQLKIGIAARY